MLAGLTAGSHGESLRHGVNVASETPFAADFTSCLKARKVVRFSCLRSSSVLKRVGNFS
jgi:hypothetical protein